MKKLFIALSAIAMLAPTAMSQTLHMHFSDGTVKSFDYSEVDSLVVEPADPYGHTFSIAVDDIQATAAVVTVSCSDPSVRYFFDLCTLESFESHHRSVEEIVEGYIELTLQKYPQLTLEQLLDPLLETGYVTEKISRLPSDTDMVCYLVAVDDKGKCYGKSAYKQFRTLKGGDPADCTFTIEAQDICSDGCVVHIVPSDPSVAYWYGICARDEYPGDAAMIASVRSAIVEAAQENGMSVEELVNRIAYTDVTTQIESGLQNSTPYYIYAYALNNSGSAAGALTKTMFTTTEYDESDAMVSLKYRYFDGDKLYAKDPALYAKYQGAVMVEATVTPNETAEHWVVALAAKDMTDKDIYPDESTKQALLQGGKLDTENMTYVARWGEATFLYFAADFYGIDGPLRRTLVNFTPENAMPIEALGSAPMIVRAAAPQINPCSRPDAITRRLDATSTQTTRH